MTDHLESPLVVVGCERNKGQQRMNVSLNSCDLAGSLGIAEF
jgi:hypothetical protein